MSRRLRLLLIGLALSCSNDNGNRRLPQVAGSDSESNLALDDQTPRLISELPEVSNGSNLFADTSRLIPAPAPKPPPTTPAQAVIAGAVVNPPCANSQGVLEHPLQTNDCDGFLRLPFSVGPFHFVFHSGRRDYGTFGVRGLSHQYDHHIKKVGDNWELWTPTSRIRLAATSGAEAANLKFHNPLFGSQAFQRAGDEIDTTDGIQQFKFRRHPKSEEFRLVQVDGPVEQHVITYDQQQSALQQVEVKNKIDPNDSYKIAFESVEGGESIRLLTTAAGASAEYLIAITAGVLSKISSADGTQETSFEWAKTSAGLALPLGLVVTSDKVIRDERYFGYDQAGHIMFARYQQSDQLFSYAKGKDMHFVNRRDRFGNDQWLGFKSIGGIVLPVAISSDYGPFSLRYDSNSPVRLNRVYNPKTGWVDIGYIANGDIEVRNGQGKTLVSGSAKQIIAQLAGGGQLLKSLQLQNGATTYRRQLTQGTINQSKEFTVGAAGMKISRKSEASGRQIDGETIIRTPNKVEITRFQDGAVRSWQSTAAGDEYLVSSAQGQRREVVSESARSWKVDISQNGETVRRNSTVVVDNKVLSSVIYFDPAATQPLAQHLEIDGDHAATIRSFYVDRTAAGGSIEQNQQYDPDSSGAIKARSWLFKPRPPLTSADTLGARSANWLEVTAVRGNDRQIVISDDSGGDEIGDSGGRQEICEIEPSAQHIAGRLCCVDNSQEPPACEQARLQNQTWQCSPGFVVDDVTSNVCDERCREPKIPVSSTTKPLTSTTKTSVDKRCCKTTSDTCTWIQSVYDHCGEAASRHRVLTGEICADVALCPTTKVVTTTPRPNTSRPVVTPTARPSGRPPSTTKVVTPTKPLPTCDRSSSNIPGCASTVPPESHPR